VVSMFGYPLYPTLFVTGFFKHLLGYYSGIHEWYCKLNGRTLLSFPPLISDSVFEGLIFFVLYGFVLSMLGVSPSAIPYVLAFTVHIVAEVVGFHKKFILYRCGYKNVSEEITS
jgi:hypothetical protein